MVITEVVLSVGPSSLVGQADVLCAGGDVTVWVPGREVRDAAAQVRREQESKRVAGFPRELAEL